jgi:2,4-dienoyl-CoA reductase-like NADH-dependent reductase (Old Yellow Enzyme family)
VRQLKQAFPDSCVMGSGYTYLKEFSPHVAQAVLRHKWTDFIGLGRMLLAYPELPRDLLEGRGVQKKRLCRSFSDCTTAPRTASPRVATHSMRITKNQRISTAWLHSRSL